MSVKKYNLNVSNFDLNSLKYNKTPEVEKFSKQRAIIYTRVSSQKQVTEWRWLESQETACRKRCKDNNVEIVWVFQDGWISWAKVERKWVLEAVEFLKKENKNYTKINFFVATEVSRISRADDMRDTLNLEAKLKATWVVLVDADWWTYEDTPEWQLLKYIKYAVASYERKQIRMRWINWKRSALLNGRRCMWTPPLWYEKIWTKTNSYVRPTEKAKILADWYEKYARGYFLNQAQFLQRLWDLWVIPVWKKWKYFESYREVIFSLFNIIFYAWKIIYPSLDINEPIQWQHEWIISRDLVLKLAPLLNKKQLKNIRLDFDAHFPLRWYLVCPNCARWITARSSKWKLQPYFYYGCSNRNCTRLQVNKNKIHSQILDIFETYSIHPQIREVFVQLVKKEFLNSKPEKENEKKFLLEKISDFEKQQTQIENTLSKIDDLELFTKFKSRRQEIQEQKNLTQNKLSEIDNDNSSRELNILQASKLLFTNPQKIFDLWNPELNRILFRVRSMEKLPLEKNWIDRTPANSPLNALFQKKIVFKIVHSHPLVQKSNTYQIAQTLIDNYKDELILFYEKHYSSLETPE